MFFTINAIGKDGKSYAIDFECADAIDAQNLIKQLGLVPDEAGICYYEPEATLDGNEEFYYGGFDPDETNH